jgi:HEAT repeat protein
MTERRYRLVHDDSSSLAEDRRIAVAALGEDRAAIEQHLLALSDADWRVRKQATIGLCARRLEDWALNQLLVQLGPGANVGMRNAVADVLAAQGLASVRLLDAALPTFDADTRKLAAEALGRSGEPGALWVLKDLLEDHDVNVRIAAIEAIALVGKEVRDPAQTLLERNLRSGDAYFTTCVLQAIDQLGVAPEWTVLEPLLENELLVEPVLRVASRSNDPAVAPHYVSALEKFRGKLWECVVHSFAQFAQSGERPRQASVAALEQVTSASLERLFAVASGPPGRLASEALTLLCVHGSKRGQRLALSLVSHEEQGTEALAALRLCGGTLEPVLIEAIQSDSEQLQVDAVSLLSELVENGQLAVTSMAWLRPLATHGSPRVVRAWLQAVTLLGDDVDLQLSARWVSDSESRSVRRAAAEAVQACASRYPQAIKGGAADVSPKSERAAIVALGMSVASEPLLDSAMHDIAFLKAAAGSEFASVRCAVMAALGNCGGSEGQSALKFALSDEAREVRMAAIRALGELRADTGEVLGTDVLLDFATTTNDSDLGVAAFQALASRSDVSASSRLCAIVRDSEGWRVIGAVEALVRLPQPHGALGIQLASEHREPSVVLAALSSIAGQRGEWQSLIIGCLAHPERWVRAYAAELLRDSNSGEAQVALARRVRQEQDPVVVEALKRSLAEVDRNGIVRESVQRNSLKGS